MSKKKHCFIILLFLVWAPYCFSDIEYDVLNLPAVPSHLTTKSLLYSVEKFGTRYFATGHRGHIIYSDDDGQSWTQAKVPVRSSITAIHFPTRDKGWAVGHDGVILHSNDGGETWVKQYDGFRYGTEGLEYYSKLAKENPGFQKYQSLIDEMKFAISQGSDKPFFEVFFRSEEHGHAIGAYGMFMETRDAGKSWRHVMHNVENDNFYHLFDFTAISGGRYFLTGEAGVLMITTGKGSAHMLENIPYDGSFYSSTSTADGAIVIGGLRGFMFRTNDDGQAWQKITKPATSKIIDFLKLSDNRIIAATQGGKLLLSEDNGKSFSLLPIEHKDNIHAIEEGAAGKILLAGPNGISIVTFE